ncbi:MAG: type I-E CRISPR-associated protein Cas6/Cse3/CasE [Methyloversatilis sp.]|uniref:type I-E CRISPR-associated protein Cas6/Cse3/CasE n=1 Tax=Methyloversatilis sp. TaxID=2569862 RepID=UPI002736B3BC|nr:type I-E CRISPR-associated protein Cas6/Cse3/CasE [Methyloversatilis sp.]MDP3872863.1 type I-E CRISPR-associated protein Cas6/Cse3/CasE [Methyloversatilis sp.]
MKLTLLQCHPDPRKLAAWATRFGLTAGGDDLGYALHTLLSSAFGDAAPKPFRHFGDARGLLGYSARDGDALQLAAQMAAPDVHAALGLERFATRSFPTEWAAGRRLGFELRVRPVLRTREGRERDVFQVAAEKTGTDEFAQSRDAVYQEWLMRELSRGEAARIETMQLEGFRLTASLRKGTAVEGKRSAQRVAGPDALFSGELTVSDPAGFAALLARGVGRHRAFGFGMLLLRPPATC